MLGKPHAALREVFELLGKPAAALQETFQPLEKPHTALREAFKLLGKPAAALRETFKLLGRPHAALQKTIKQIGRLPAALRQVFQPTFPFLPALPDDFHLRISLLAEHIRHFFPPIALNDDLALLRRAAHATLYLEHLAQRGEIVGRAPETGDERDHLPTPVPLIERDAKALLRLGEGFLLRHFVCFVLKVRVRRIHHAQTAFPIVILHFFPI